MTLPGSCPACGAYPFAIAHAAGCRLDAFRLKKGDRFQMLTGRFLVLSVRGEPETPRRLVGSSGWAWRPRDFVRHVLRVQDELGYEREVWFGSGDIAWPDGEYPQPPAQEEHRTWAEWRRG